MKTGSDVVDIISWDVAVVPRARRRVVVVVVVFPWWWPAHADARALPRPRLLVSVAVAATLPASSALETQFELSSRLHHDARPTAAREELFKLEQDDA